MAKFAVAALQLDLRAEDNVARIGAEVAAVKRRQPWLDMIVLPELSAHGPGIARAEPARGPSETAFRQVAHEQGVWLIPGSVFERHGDHVYNVASVIDPHGTVVARYRKMFPFRPYEEGVSPGDAFCIVPIEGIGRIGVSICYDIWFPETTRSLAWLGVDALICPTLTDTIDRDVECAIARASAACNQCYVVNVNAGAPLGVGRSIVCGPGGEVLHEAGPGYEVAAVELDFDYVARVRRQGWNGLGQPLKSFRDSTVQFPAYRRDAPSAALEELGPLTRPASLRPV